MTEWLILLLLVPVIVVPVVLLFGFAGCDKVWGLDEVQPPPPTITAVRPLSVSVLSVEWTYSGVAASYLVERTDPQFMRMTFAPGSYALAVLAWYGSGRFVLEPLRERPDVVFGRVRINRVVAALLALGAGGALFVRGWGS
jgi:hypothetical protein